MSLLTDIIFVKALRSNQTLMGLLAAGDVYNTTIALPDVDYDNAPLPYAIVSYDSMQSQESTKDDNFEGNVDVVQISIEVAAATRPLLGQLVTSIRQTIREYFGEHYGDTSDAAFGLIPFDVTLSAEAVTYDADKPCYWQILHYQCDTDID